MDRRTDTLITIWPPFGAIITQISLNNYTDEVNSILACHDALLSLLHKLIYWN